MFNNVCDTHVPVKEKLVILEALSFLNGLIGTSFN